MKPVRIADRFVGDGYPCFTISEVGINCVENEKDIGLVKKMIDMSKRAGFDSVKFQLFTADEMYNKKAGTYVLEGKKIDIYKEMKRVALPFDWVQKLKEYADKRGIILFASCWGEKSTDALDKAGVPAFKIGSYDITNLPLLRYVAKKGKPMIVSTGGAYLSEVEEAVRAIKEAGNDQIILMQCVAKYPAPLSASNVSVMRTMKKAFDVPVGYSDNGSGFVEADLRKYGRRAWMLAPLASTAFGSNILEKHTTLDRTMRGNDQQYSIEEDEQREMIHKMREIEQRLKRGEKIRVHKELVGTGVKEPNPVEVYVRNFAYKRMFTAKKIKKGEKITNRNIKIVRPGQQKGGMTPKFYHMIVNKARANKNLNEDAPLNFEDIIYQ